jgi:hypothetical protein
MKRIPLPVIHTMNISMSVAFFHSYWLQGPLQCGKSVRMRRLRGWTSVPASEGREEPANWQVLCREEKPLDTPGASACGMVIQAMERVKSAAPVTALSLGNVPFCLTGI